MIKKIILLLGTALLCLIITSSNGLSQSDINYGGKTLLTQQTGNVSPSKLQARNTLAGESLSESSSQLSYRKAYMDFLLNIDASVSNFDFPIKGYYLLDLNFDQVPELGIYHDSGGSMGGYFRFYYFNGNKIAAILDNQNEPVTISNYTQILADYENEKIYLLKEMYLLAGNNNGTYGYLREIINQDSIPSVYDILKLNVNEELNLLEYESSNYGEDEYLLDPKLKGCLITQYYSATGWTTIMPDQYYKLKRERIPLKNSFIDLRDTDVYFLGTVDGGTEEYQNIKITEEEINALFLKWLDYVK